MGCKAGFITIEQRSDHEIACKEVRNYIVSTNVSEQAVLSINSNA